MVDPDAIIANELTRLNIRKLRLFACACVRQIWDLLVDEKSRKTVMLAERYADGLAPLVQLTAAHRTAERAAERIKQLPAWCAAWSAAWSATTYVPYSQGRRTAAYEVADGTAVRAATAITVARISAQKVSRKKAWPVEWAKARTRQLDLLHNEFLPPAKLLAVDPEWLAWQGGIVRKFATAIYRDRRFYDTSILADALEEAGCTDMTVLKHLRYNTEHVRGCWALDLLRGVSV